MSPTAPPPRDAEGFEFRRTRGRVMCRHINNAGWTPVRLRDLAEAYPADSPLWTWLRSLGVRRPGPSGSASNGLAPPPTFSATVAGITDEYRVTEAGIEHREWDARAVRIEWHRMSAREMREEADADSPLWDWLRSHGFRRPSPSGPSGTSTPRSRSKRKHVEVTLSDAAYERLSDAARRYGSKSKAIEALLMGEVGK